MPRLPPVTRRTGHQTVNPRLDSRPAARAARCSAIVVWSASERPCAEPGEHRRLGALDLLGAGQGGAQLVGGGDGEPVVVTQHDVARPHGDPAEGDGALVEPARVARGARRRRRPAGEHRQPERPQARDVAAVAVDDDPGQAAAARLGGDELAGDRPRAAGVGDDQHRARRRLARGEEHRQVVVGGHDGDRGPGHPHAGHHRPDRGVGQGEGLVGVAQRGGRERAGATQLVGGQGVHGRP